MSFYGVLLILLPISMAGVLAMPGLHHGHTQNHANHLPHGHPIRHHRQYLGLKKFDDKESSFVLEEDDLEKEFKAKCGYTVEMVPCTANNCAKQYLRHIKCNHTGQSHGNGYCIQTFRKVQMNCTGSSEDSTHLYTGCVFATPTRMAELASNDQNQ